MRKLLGLGLMTALALGGTSEARADGDMKLGFRLAQQGPGLTVKTFGVGLSATRATATHVPIIKAPLDVVNLPAGAIEDDKRETPRLPKERGVCVRSPCGS